MAWKSLIPLGPALLLLVIASDCQASDGSTIVGGTEANIEDFPWHVLMLRGDAPSCGGAIISDVWVLTAAHCGHRKRLMAGSDTRSSGGEYYPIVERHDHPAYSVTVDDDYDLAVIKVGKPYKFNEKVQPVRLLASQDPAEGSRITVTGFGRTQEDDPTKPDHLMKVTVTVLPTSTCKEAFGNGFTSRMFCAASLGKDACKGDSGGPAVKYNSSDLVGIVSWGIGCARPDKPGVYSNVAALREWIRETTGV